MIFGFHCLIETSLDLNKAYGNSSTNLSEVAHTVFSRLIDVKHLVHVWLLHLLIDQREDSQQSTDVANGRDEEDFGESSCLWISGCSCGRRAVDDEFGWKG